MPLDQTFEPSPPKPPLRQTDVAMPLGDHLDELRRRVIWSIVGIAAALVLTCIYGFRLVSLLAQPLLQAQDALGFAPQLIVTEPTAGFTSVYLPVTLISAVILACPWVFFQFWRFVSVGLYAQEKRAVYFLVPFSSLLAFLGVAFSYFVLLPISLLFFMNFATFYPAANLDNPNPLMSVLLDSYREPVTPGDADTPPLTDAPRFTQVPVLGDAPDDPPEGSLWIDPVHHRLNVHLNGRTRHVAIQSDRLINPLPRFGQYIRFATFMTLGVTLAFQLPIVMLALGRTGLVAPAFLRNQRRYAVLICVVLAAVATPADPLSMLVLAVPLYLLFELGLLLMTRAAVRRCDA